MEKEIVGGKIGAVGEYDLELKDGKLVGSVSLDASPIVDRLFALAKSKIPGEFDDLVLDKVREYLKSAVGV